MKPIRILSSMIFALLLCSGTSSIAEPALQEIRVFPSDHITLTTSRDRQSVVLQAVYDNETTRDLTSETTFSLANPAFATLEGNVVHPKADGETELVMQVMGQTKKLPIKVEKSSEDRPISFNLDVMPVFMKTGCNTGPCHGSARGQDGFMLSLFGYDPNGDYHRITREMAGRRINLAVPHDSLMVQKSLGSVPHTGGECFTEDSEYYETMVRWLKAGAPNDKEDIAKPVSLEIMPNRIVLEGEGSSQQLTVRAKYSDGTDRDVTSTAVFITNNETSAPVTETGLVSASQRGEAFILARFETFNVGAQVIVIPKDPSFKFPEVAENNYIDTKVHTKLKKLRIIPSEVCTDEAFLRRVFIDITGQAPTEQDFDSFIASTDPKKREYIVDELLSRKEFVDMWVMKWAELLQIRSGGNQNRTSYKAALLYYKWLEEKISNNVPINKVVKEILTASGGTFKHPATNYYQIEQDTLKTAENVAQVFMGTRIQCAQCHNHPFDRWTMNDYYSFANFFSRIGRKRAEDPRESIIYDKTSGDTKHLVSKQALPPKFLGGEQPVIKQSTDRRNAVAEWLTAPENPYFSRNLSNIIWAHFFGQGIVDPVDDVRVSNPASNPELLDELASKLVEYNYDFKKLVKDITLSRTYQLSTQTNPTNELDQRNFAKGSIRRMRAEVLLDVITQVTGTQNKFKGLPLGARAVQIADGATQTYFLTTFGRATRETVCSCEVSMEPNLSQALHLLNGDTVNNKVKQGNFVGKQLEAGNTPEQIIESIYILALTRKPTEQQMKKLMDEVNKSEDKKAVLEDIFWATLNAKEFIFNH